MFGNDSHKPVEPAPTQEHVPVEMVRDGVVISRPSQRSGRIVAAVLRVGARDVTRMAEGERADFLEQYANRLAQWRFPYQILVWRERQNPAEFLQRVRERQAAWQTGAHRQWAGHLRQMTGWMERVIVQVNPQIPAYFVALPHPVSRLLGQPYEKALEKLDSRCRMVTSSLGALLISCVRLEDRGILDMIAGFYHPSLPMLRIPPSQRLASLIAGDEER